MDDDSIIKNINEKLAVKSSKFKRRKVTARTNLKKGNQKKK